MSSDFKLLHHPRALCNALLRLAIEAGNITLDYYEGLKDMGIEQKDDNSPVTKADKEAEKHIIKELLKLAPAVPVVGEELTSEGNAPNPAQDKYFWLVDPLDGTREFIKGSGEYTVNIALIENDKPIMGVIVAPALETAYAGFLMKNNKGELEIESMRLSILSDKERRIKVRPPPREGITIVSSRSHGDKSRLEGFMDNYKVAKLLKKGSSLKMCLIAEGKADMYPRFGPTCEWDTAAAHAILNAAGGEICDLKGSPLRYGNFKAAFKNPEFIASSFQWHSPDLVL